MSAALTLMAKDRGGPKLRLQVLLIPATDTNFHTASYSDFESGRFLARAFMKFGWDIYAPDAKTRLNPYAVPMRASVDQLRGLPPALVVTAENDPLRDEGEAYAAALRDAGVPVELVRWPGTIHGFFRWLAATSVAGEAVDAVAAALRRALAVPVASPR
jgi:acetyl esterase